MNKTLSRYNKVLLLSCCVFALGHLAGGPLGLAPGGGAVLAGDAKLDSSQARTGQDDRQNQFKAVVTTSRGSHVFTVEVARTEHEKAKGLMYRTEMAASRGMVFVFDPPRFVTMWMRNTALSLDMLFVGIDGTIVHIEADTVPMSESLIGSGGVTALVVELKAGTAKRFGFRVGDRVELLGL